MSELEDRIEEAVAGQIAYDAWRAQYAAECLRRGIAYPNSFGLQRAWNAYQKKQAELRRGEKMKLSRIKQLEEVILRAQEEIKQLSGAAHSPIANHQNSSSSNNSLVAPSAEPDEQFFAQIDAEVAAIQAGDTGGWNSNRSTVAPDRALRILQEEEQALKKNNLGEL